MKSHTYYHWFNTKNKRDYVLITDLVEEQLRKSGIKEGLCLVSAMHITAGGVYQRRRGWPYQRYR
jgi:thiamine phosphate synthase YjbQ (UPF0047 family)